MNEFSLQKHKFIVLVTTIKSDVLLRTTQRYHLVKSVSIWSFSVFYRIWIVYGDLRSESLDSVYMRKNADNKNS